MLTAAILLASIPWMSVAIMATILSRLENGRERQEPSRELPSGDVLAIAIATRAPLSTIRRSL